MARTRSSASSRRSGKNTRAFINSGNWGWWLSLGLVLSLMIGVITYDLVVSDTISTGAALMVAAGAAGTFLALYVTVSAFLNSIGRP